MRVVSGAEAVANIANEPCNIILYGPPGTQKTTDAVRAFIKGDRCTAFFISCEHGALKPILARGLPMPDHPDEPVTTWEGLVEAVTYAGNNRGKYNAVVIDTLTTWTKTVYAELEGRKWKNRWDIPVAMRGMLTQLRDGCRALGLHVIMVAHSAPPSFSEAGALKYKGAPLMVPSTAINLFHPTVDTMLRVDNVITGMDTRRVYFTGGTEWPNEFGMPPADMQLWWTKNREGCGSAIVPADLGAFLRARRPPYANL